MLCPKTESFEEYFKATLQFNSQVDKCKPATLELGAFIELYMNQDMRLTGYRRVPVERPDEWAGMHASWYYTAYQENAARWLNFTCQTLEHILDIESLAAAVREEMQEQPRNDITREVRGRVYHRWTAPQNTLELCNSYN